MLEYKEIIPTCIYVIKIDAGYIDCIRLDKVWAYGVKEITSDELRQIADKLDELNEVIK